MKKRQRNKQISTATANPVIYVFIITFIIFISDTLLTYKRVIIYILTKTETVRI